MNRLGSQVSLLGEYGVSDSSWRANSQQSSKPSGTTAKQLPTTQYASHGCHRKPDRYAHQSTIKFTCCSFMTFAFTLKQGSRRFSKGGRCLGLLYPTYRLL